MGSLALIDMSGSELATDWRKATIPPTVGPGARGSAAASRTARVADYRTYVRNRWPFGRTGYEATSASLVGSSIDASRPFGRAYTARTKIPGRPWALSDRRRPVTDVALTARHLVGREDELAAIVGLLDAPEQCPGVAVLPGEAGIGKT